MIIPRIHTDLCLLHFNSSWKVETAHSVRAIELVRAANSTNTKNRIPISVPSPILSNTLGIVMNINDGPALRFSIFPPENANTAGIIIKPAIIAIAVSNTSTFSVELSIETFFSVYEPNVMRIPIAIDNE